MEELNTTEIVKHITLGTDEVLFFPYNEGKEPLPLRPISSFELDQCFYNSLQYAPSNVASLIIKIKLKLIDTKRDIDVSDEGYVELQRYTDAIDYWIVYYSMKDFQDITFSMPDYDELECHPKGFYTIRDKMEKVHEIASFVMDASYRNKEVIKEIFTDEIGREVGYCIYYLNMPLAEIGKLTKLQRSYIIYSKNHLPKIIKGKRKEIGYIRSGEQMTLKDFLDRMGVSYADS